MKRSFILIIMLLVAPGCSMSGKQDEKIAAPPPPVAASTPATTASTPESNASLSDTGSLTMENYRKIENGMSYQEVAALLGSGGEETRRSNIENIELKSLKWKGDNYQRVYVNFRDGKVNSKTQTGLK